MSRICIVIQSAAFASSAGMRVRYERFIGGAVGLGVTVVAKPLSDLLNAPIEEDIYLFCKTFSAEAVVFAQRVKSNGKVVAQDLFDDYFSQTEDQRLFPFREWLTVMARYTDVAVCTTPRMQAVLTPYFPSTSIHVIEDPVAIYDPTRLLALAERKTARVRASGRLQVAWFGIGDNPFFPVGIANLTSPASLAALAELSQGSLRPHLKIVTNARALHPGGLASLRALPIDYELIEWSESVEQDILQDTDVALLPVGSQGFSIAKSLNRALTALMEGCQILSLDADLYQDLAPVRYRSAADLVSDYEAGSPKLCAERIPFLSDFIARRANAFELGSRFVAALRAATATGARPLAVIHGRDATIGLHKLASLSGLSVRTPYVSADWNFPVRFENAGNQVIAKISRPLAEARDIRLVPGSDERIGDFDFGIVRPGLYSPVNQVVDIGHAHPIGGVAYYGRVMAGIRQAMSEIFPDHDCLVADPSSYRADFGLRVA